jgi:hypothetical protein
VGEVVDGVGPAVLTVDEMVQVGAGQGQALAGVGAAQVAAAGLGDTDV